jgi:hypothetical protein
MNLLQTLASLAALALGVALLVVFAIAAWWWAVDRVIKTFQLSREFFRFMWIRRQGNPQFLFAASHLLQSQRALLDFHNTPVNRHRERELLLGRALAAALTAKKIMEDPNASSRKDT